MPNIMNDTNHLHQGWSLSRLHAETDFGLVDLEGTIQLPQKLISQGTIESLLDQSFTLHGHADLNEMSRRFPGLLRVQEDVELKQGNGDFHFAGLIDNRQVC